jgi:hypothetical protein
VQTFPKISVYLNGLWAGAAARSAFPLAQLLAALLGLSCLIGLKSTRDFKEK